MSMSQGPPPGMQGPPGMQQQQQPGMPQGPPGMQQNPMQPGQAPMPNNMMMRMQNGPNSGGFPPNMSPGMQGMIPMDGMSNMLNRGDQREEQQQQPPLPQQQQEQPQFGGPPWVDRSPSTTPTPPGGPSVGRVGGALNGAGVGDPNNNNGHPVNVNGNNPMSAPGSANPMLGDPFGVGSGMGVGDLFDGFSGEDVGFGGDINFERDFGQWFHQDDLGLERVVNLGSGMGIGNPHPSGEFGGDINFERDFGQWFNHPDDVVSNGLE